MVLNIWLTLFPKSWNMVRSDFFPSFLKESPALGSAEMCERQEGTDNIDRIH